MGFYFDGTEKISWNHRTRIDQMLATCAVHAANGSRVGLSMKWKLNANAAGCVSFKGMGGCTASYALIEPLVKSDTPFSQQRRLTHESQSRIQASTLYPCVGFYGGLAFFLDLFSEVVLQADLFDRLHLRFDPIDMLIHVFGHILKHVPRGEIVHLCTMHDTIVE